MSHECDNRERQATDDHLQTHCLHSSKHACLDALILQQGPIQIALPSKSFRRIANLNLCYYYYYNYYYDDDGARVTKGFGFECDSKPNS